LVDYFRLSHAGDDSGDSFALLVSDDSQEASFLRHGGDGCLLDTAGAFSDFHHGDLVEWD
jgi:hypothetical protein